MHDDSQSGFYKRRKKGEIIVNPMSSARSEIVTSSTHDYTRKEEDLVGGVWTTSSYTRQWAISGLTARLRLPHTLIANRWGSGSSADAQIRADFGFSSAYALESPLLLRAVNNATSSEALALVTLAELNKTLAMLGELGHRAQRMDKLLKRLSESESAAVYVSESAIRRPPKGSYRLAKRRMKDWIAIGDEAASAWLAYRYGVMATFYDVLSWIDASSATGRARRARFASHQSSSYDSGIVSSVGSTSNWHQQNYTERFQRTSDSSAGVITQLNVQADHLDTHGVRNIISSAWELVPYSFVLDWFVDAGDRLTALEGQYLRPILGSWVVHRHSLRQSRSAVIVGKTTVIGSKRYTGVYNDTAYLDDVGLIVERKANPSVSILPQIKVNLNWKRMVDGLALLRQAAKRRRQRW